MKKRSTFATVLLLAALTAGCTASPKVYLPVTRPPVAESTELTGTIAGFAYYPDSNLPETPFAVDVETDGGIVTLRYAEAQSERLALGDTVTIADGEIIEVNGEEW